MMIRSVLTRSITSVTRTFSPLIGFGGNGRFKAVSGVNYSPATVHHFHTSSENPAARKGTRARKAKGRVKKEEKVRPFLRKLEEDKRKVQTDSRPFDRSHYPVPVDDVYFYRKYQVTQWDFKEAVQNHREVHHPSVYNMPNATLLLRIDMDFRYPNRPQKCMDPWRGMVPMKAPFFLPGMEVPPILAIVPPGDEGYINDALAAGADVAGSIEIVKQIQQGEIRSNDFEFIVCHPLVVSEITPIRGVLKKNFPSFKTGTIDLDVPAAVKRLKGGLKYRVIHNDTHPDYAYVETPIGTLNMDAVGLEGNFESLLSDVLGRRVAGKSANEFILQCLIKTPYTFEAFKINIQDLIQRNDKKKGEKMVEGAEGETAPIVEEADEAQKEATAQ